MSNNLIEERDERTKRRKAIKKKMDKVYSLSYKDDEKMMLSVGEVMKLSDTKIRLLDEGAVVGDDFVSFIIKKGTLEKFMSGNNESLPNIDPNETYTVNLGHLPFAEFPILLGEWTKADLTLVDIGDERRGVDVDVRLDYENPLVQQLARQPFDVGVSAEFYYHTDWESTMELGIQVIDEVCIFAYGIVGECGNVNSSGLELKGDFMKDKETIENIIEEEILDETKELGVEEVEIPPTDEEEAEETAEEEVIDESEEEAEEEIVEDEAEEEAEGEEVEIEEVEDEEEADDDEDDDEEAVEIEELAIIDELRKQIQNLSSKIDELEQTNAKLKKNNRKLSAKYQNELDKKAKFKEELKGLSVELLPDEDKKNDKEELKVSDKNYYHGDGIGEI